MKQTTNHFKQVNPKQDFVALEDEVRRFWEQNNVQKRYLLRNKDKKKRHSFFDGPITANNKMGVHHAWGRFYKDLFQRFYNMKGYKQRFQNGFDGQGLWVEVEVEKALGFTSKKDIETFGIDRFVEECKKRVNHFASVITEQSKLLAYFMDWDNSYHTMSDANNYAIWKFLKRCKDKGWLYEGRDVMPWCSRCGTGLSQHEIVTDGYREITHKSLYVMLPIVEQPGVHILVWTTTPWTIPCNVVATVNPKYDYVKVANTWQTNQGEKKVEIWLSANRLSVLKGEYKILEKVKGKELLDLHFVGPFDHYPINKEASKAHEVLEWEEVSDDEGTGIVHNAPACGAEDYQIGRKYDLPIKEAVTESGVYLDGFGELSGQKVSDVFETIVDTLKKQGMLYRTQNYKHRYPVCWRCGTELIFRLVNEWFISMQELRPTMVEATKRIEWVPQFGLERELDWLKNMGDWMISKKRYWGLALPIFKCVCGNVEVVGGKKELQERAVEGFDEFLGHSPHKPWIDKVKISCSKCNKKISRIKDVGNPWLDAGIIPFSTLSDEERDEWYPSSWISESFPGQFRNWFYSLIAMSAAMREIEPTKAVFSYALMCDENGEEMHKSKGNSIWFEDAANKMGVDVMRFLFARQTPANNLNFGYNIGNQIRRQFFIPLWNVYSFFVTYANLDGWDGWRADSEVEKSYTELDLWIKSELNQMVTTVEKALKEWKPERASKALESFVDLLSNWYVRRSRRRFWKTGDLQNKNAAYETLYTCLFTLAKVLAPFTPHIAEDMYQNLNLSNSVGEKDSVHLCDWPSSDQKAVDKNAIERMNLAICVVEMGRRIRSSANIKTRQPLEKLFFTTRDDALRALFLSAKESISAIICDEINVKSVELIGTDSAQQLLGNATIALDFKKVGPKYGKKAQGLKTTLLNASASKHNEWAVALEACERVELTKGVFLTIEDVIVSRDTKDKDLQTESRDGYTVALDTNITEKLRDEGFVREFVHKLQNLRKDKGFEISDRINLCVSTSGQDNLEQILRRHSFYIVEELLVTKLSFVELSSSEEFDELLVEKESIKLKLTKA